MYMYRIIYLLICSPNYILSCPFLRTIPWIIQRELLNKHLKIVPGQLFIYVILTSIWLDICRSEQAIGSLSGWHPMLWVLR